MQDVRPLEKPQRNARLRRDIAPGSIVHLLRGNLLTTGSVGRGTAVSGNDPSPDGLVCNGSTWFEPADNSVSSYFNTAPQNRNPFTLIAVCRPSGIGTDVARTVIGNTLTSTESGWALFYENRTAVSSPNRMRLFVARDVNGALAYDGYFGPLLSSAERVVSVVSTDTAGLNLAVNGIAETAAWTNAADTGNSDRVLHIGRANFTSTTNPFDGPIESVALIPRKFDLRWVRDASLDPYGVLFEPRRRVIVPVAAAAGAAPVTASLSAALQQARSLTASLSAAVQAPRTTSTSLDIAAQQARSATASLQLAAEQARSATASLDLAAQAGATRTASLDSALQEARSATASLSAYLQAGSAVVASLDIALQTPRSATAGVDVALQLARTAGASLSLAAQAARTASTSLSIQLQAGTSQTAALDIAIEQARSASASLSAAVSALRSAQAQVSAALAVQRTVGAALDAAAQARRSGTLGLSLYVDAGAGLPQVPPWRTWDIAADGRTWLIPADPRGEDGSLLTWTTGTTAMRTEIHDLDAQLDYAWDWTEWLDDANRTIASYSISADAGVTVVDHSRSGAVVTAVLALDDGVVAVADRLRVTCRITTDGTPALTEDRTRTLFVAQR